MNGKSLEVRIAYIHGRIEAQLEGFAASMGIPAEQLAKRVGALLLGPPSGEVLGIANPVPELSHTSTDNDSPARKMAVGSGASSQRLSAAFEEPAKVTRTGRRPMSAAARKRISVAAKRRWAAKRKAA